ncbi:hypothetical protein [Chromobacterium amazonense]|nr:hypothetical protein [Chromobacterium amazonense]
MTPAAAGHKIACAPHGAFSTRTIMHTIKPRNPLACAPILKKGGAHATSRSGQRHAQKQALWAELQDWNEWDDHPLAASQGEAGAEEAFLANAAAKATGHPEDGLLLLRAGMITIPHNAFTLCDMRCQ